MTEKDRYIELEQKNQTFAEMKRLAEVTGYKTADYYAFCDALRTYELETQLEFWTDELAADEDTFRLESYCEARIRLHEALLKDHLQRTYQGKVEMPGYAAMYERISDLEEQAEREDYQNNTEAGFPFPQQQMRRYAQLNAILFSKGQNPEKITT